MSPVLSNHTERRLDEVLHRLGDDDRSLALAESCTGGLLSSLFTDMPGLSHVFKAGFVTYSNEAKARMLGINPDMIETVGPVSRSVAIAMAQGAQRNSGADYALSVTGFAGAAGAGDEPGLVHFACALPDGTILHRECHFGDVGRGDIRLACLDTAIDLLHHAITLKDK